MTAESPTSRPTSETDRAVTGTAVSADVWIGDEPYEVDEDTKTLIHSCGEHLFGDGAIAEHVCRDRCPECERGYVVEVGRQCYETGHTPIACSDNCGWSA